MIRWGKQSWGKRFDRANNRGANDSIGQTIVGQMIRWGKQSWGKQFFGANNCGATDRGASDVGQLNLTPFMIYYSCSIRQDGTI
jgi:hypothetical protein